MKNSTGYLLLSGLVAAFIVLNAQADNKQENNPDVPNDSSVILEQREELDKTVWAPEVEAQTYEAVFTRLWDRIRAGDASEKFAALADFPIQRALTLGTPGSVETLDAEISLTTFLAKPTQTFSAAEWGTFVRSFQDAGIRIIQTEWHHSRFVPANTTHAPQSTISFSIHAIREATRTTFAVKGNLEVQWAEGTGGDPVAESVAVTGLTLQDRSDGGVFREILNLQHGPDDFISAFPILVYDLDSDGLSEIIVPRWNTVWWNKGALQFEQSKLLDQPTPIWEAGIFSDFNGDGNADFITVGKDGKPYFYAGTEQGRFPSEAVACAAVHFDMPTAITAGDADGDGDLDLWMTQYKLSFNDGQMPTPFYDANDGPPSYYLINDGTGSFVDRTVDAGLSPLRNRRSYSASFVDLDDDGDLDLLNVSDYAGLDIYRNTGKGKFQLDTESFVKDRHFFGMGHTIGDYNQDGLLDFYVIGMSSTTARRLDRLDLGREDRPDVHPMRAAMGYGNRLYLGAKGKETVFSEDTEVAAAVARTGWSWGATTFDFDLDGDQDIYVANGHRSGKSCQDYCTTFWRHDIYTGNSEESEEILKVFQTTLNDLNLDEISWNGYEKNVLFVNQADRPGRFVNSAFMFGAANSYDARSVISDDFDADGRPDLVVAKTAWNGRGFALQIHVYANDVTTGQTNNWFSVRLRESAVPGFSPNGAKVAITDDQGKVQTRWIVTGDSFLAQHAPVAHFGLGQAQHVTTVEVTWPNGDSERHDNLSFVNTSVTIRGDAPGSEPASVKTAGKSIFQPAVPEFPELDWEEVRAFNIPLNNPAYVPPAKAEFMRADDTVLGVILGDEVRAYPWEVMANYHAVNDYLDGQPIIVNMCEACNGAAAFLATVPGTVLDIRPRGLKNGTWYGIDFQTGSLWYPFIGEAFEGPLKGTKLERIRTYFSSWEDWVREHPATTVVVNTDEMRLRPHGRASKMAACETFNPAFLKRITDPKPNPNRDLLPGHTLVFGLIPAGDEKPQAFTIESLSESKSLVQTTLDGTPLLLMVQNTYQIGAYKRELNGAELTFELTSDSPLVMTDQRGNTWNMWGRTIEGPDHPSELALVDGYMAKWYEWVENFPETELIETE